MLQTSILVLLLLLVGSCSAPRIARHEHPDRTVTLLAVNDIHANLDAFPRFAYMVDSLRNVCPDLLLLSAGDNQTGNPANDQYSLKGFPVIDLMNSLQFDLSAVGNHEFDTGQKGFADLTRYADFDFVCSNLDPPEAYTYHIHPYKVLQLRNGLKVGIASLLHLNSQGLPDCAPAYTEGFKFYDPYEIAGAYEGMKDSCDVVIFLNHLGKEGDIRLARTYPEGRLDLIIGGHSHSKIDTEHKYQGILVTQAQYKLHYATLIRLTVTSGGQVDSHMQLLPIDLQGTRDASIEKKVDKYRKENPEMLRPIAALEAPFETREQLGYLMADALQHAVDVDISLMNRGGVRQNQWDLLEVTPYDVFRLDPFDNQIVTIDLSGEELYAFYEAAYNADTYRILYGSGIYAEYYLEAGALKNLKLFTMDGQPVDLQRTYHVGMNSYLMAAIPFTHDAAVQNTYLSTSENLIHYLKKQQTIRSYQREKRVKIFEQ